LLEKFPNLQRLHLTDNAIGYNGAVAIAKLMRKNILRNLHLSNNNIGFDGAIEIVSALSENCNLQSLDLCYNNISSTEALTIIKLLAGNDTLRSIDFYDKENHFNIDEIVNMMHNNYALTYMNFGFYNDRKYEIIERNKQLFQSKPSNIKKAKCSELKI
jgi:Ran GTPase-activating protein (RanGAP) involved in mRNA processing and transport